MTGSAHRPASGWGEQNSPGQPESADPAYASQTPYGVPYQPSNGPAPTRVLPAFSPYDAGATTGYSGMAPQSNQPAAAGPAGGPSRRWLWVLAGGAVLVVIGLVIALVIVSSAQQTVFAPGPTLDPSTTSPSSPRTAPRRTTPTAAPTVPALPALPFPLPGQPTPSAPGTSAPPGQTVPVNYQVSGTGRAMSITYVDSGGVLQTEFNVPLPWSRQVELTQPANSSASVTVINFGRELTCSVTVSGRVVDHRTGAGLTICGARG